MSRIHFIGGEKGGVGKSVVSRLLAQYYIDQQIPFRAYDADLSHGAMMRYYADYSRPVDITHYESADSIIEEFAENPLRTVVDLPAQSDRTLGQWIEDTGLLDLAGEMGISLTFWHILDAGSDSLHLLQRTLEKFAGAAGYVVVRNHGRGSDFSHFDKSQSARYTSELKGRILDLPALHPPTMNKIDHIDASFWAAANNTDPETGPILGLLERQRVKIWLNRSYAQLKRVDP